MKHIFLIYLLAITLRIYAISDGNILFYFDQARDAIVSQQIINQHDFKIMGPSVSGTNDSVYHGVLYYYLISPVYYFAQGNPQVLGYFLAIFSSLSVFIVYQIGKIVFKSKNIGKIAALFQAFSTISIQQSTWLSNPVLANLFVPAFYLMLWLVFNANKKTLSIKWTIALSLCLAAAIQATLQNVFLFGSVLLMYGYHALIDKRLFIFSFKHYLIFFATFFTLTSSMLITEVLMFKRGILSFESLNLAGHPANLIDNFLMILSRYAQLINDFVFQHYAYLSVIVTIFIFIISWKKKFLDRQQALFIFAFFFSPVWLLLWHYRDPPHTFISLEVPIYLLFGLIIDRINKIRNWTRTFSFLFFFGFLTTNLLNLLDLKNQCLHKFVIQRGTCLSNQLQVIDESYRLANGQAFSISTLTAPYGYNTTWSYLYSWYGQQKYHYLPEFIGPAQAGLVGENLLKESSQAMVSHFTIIEPDTTLNDNLQTEFQSSQDRLAGEVIKEYNFGTLKMQYRKTK